MNLLIALVHPANVGFMGNLVKGAGLGQTSAGANPPRGTQTRANFNSPSFSIPVVILSPALSHTCFSGGMPKITPSGVPVKKMSPGFKVKCCDA